MAETTATDTDIFQQQKKTIELLQDVIAKQQSQPPQTVYVEQAQQPQQKAPNYLLWIGAGLLALLFLGKRKLL